MKYFIVGAALFLYIFNVIVAKELPSYIKKCKKDVSEEELAKCLIDRAYSVLPRLIGKGIPELKLPQIEPLLVPQLAVNAPNIDMTFKDIQIFGLDKINLKKFRIDFKEKTIELLLVIPFMTLNSNYDIKGKIILFEINSSGPSSLNITDVTSESIQRFEIKNKNGKNYLQLKEKIKSNITYNNGGIRFENVFPGNEQLTNEVNNVMNDNFNEITKDINPIIFQSVSKIIDEVYLGPMLNDFSIEELFD